ncbi:LPS assembly lipoprotein LptE [Candidatus Omnitrophota bacterium]
MRIVFVFLISIFLVTASGCGYTTSSLLPPGMDSIHVDNFANKINPAKEVSDKRASYSYWPNLETDITRAVIDGFIFDRHLDIDRESKAALVLKGELMSFRQYPLSYDKSDTPNVEEFRIEILVNIELYDNESGKLMWKEDSFLGESTYDVAGPNAVTEAEGVREAVKDLSARIVERVVEAW